MKLIVGGMYRITNKKSSKEDDVEFFETISEIASYEKFDDCNQYTILDRIEITGDFIADDHWVINADTNIHEFEFEYLSTEEYPEYYL